MDKVIPAAAGRYRVYDSSSSGTPRNAFGTGQPGLDIAVQDCDSCIGQTGKVPGGQRMRAWQRPSSQVTSRTRCSRFPMRIAAGRRPWRLTPLSFSVLRRGAARMFFVRGADLLTCPSSDGVVQGFGPASNGPLSIGHNYRARTGGTTTNRDFLRDEPLPSEDQARISEPGRHRKADRHCRRRTTSRKSSTKGGAGSPRSDRGSLFTRQPGLPTLAPGACERTGTRS